MLAILEIRNDTRTLRKNAGNKLAYSIQTISTGRQMMNVMGFEGRDLQRGEALIDTFTVIDREDIIKAFR